MLPRADPGAFRVAAAAVAQPPAAFIAQPPAAVVAQLPAVSRDAAAAAAPS